MKPTTRISSIKLRVNSLDSTTAFYGDALGMQKTGETRVSESYAFTENACNVLFQKHSGAEFVERKNNLFWKIGITVKNLAVAVQFLRSQNISVSEPAQFKDIGFLCHLHDPNGLPVELLQCGFQGREQHVPDGHPIAAQATLAHLTLRVTNIQAAAFYFEQSLGMRLMSVQDVSDYDFCLYFYAWTDEILPDPDITSVKNREWLWQRPYTLVELQHLKSPDSVIHKNENGESGFDSFSYVSPATHTESTVSIKDLAALT